MEYGVWNTLHDGSIEAIDGQVRGDVRLRVSIIYLCEKLPTAADYLTITLRGCSRFEFQPYDANAINDLGQIAKLDLDILSARPGIDCIGICCGNGTLFLTYQEVERRLAEGTVISQAELEDAAERYWTEWSKMRDEL